MASARNSLVFTAGVVGCAYRWSIVTKCATRDGQEKKLIVFFVVFIAEFRLCSG